MGEILTYEREGLIYPGLYTPLPQIESLLKELKIPRKGSVEKLLVKIKELEDSYRVSITFPEVKKEDIIIHAHNNILSVAVLTRNWKELKNKKPGKHKPNSKLIKQNILLPQNADTEFVSAEYKQGELILYIPKAQNTSETDLKQIVVY